MPSTIASTQTSEVQVVIVISYFVLGHRSQKSVNIGLRKRTRLVGSVLYRRGLHLELERERIWLLFYWLKQRNKNNLFFSYRSLRLNS